MSPTLIWFCVAVAFVLVEIFSLAFVALFFAIGALGAAAVSALDGSAQAAAMTFVCISVASLFLLRRLLKRTFSGSWRKAQDQSGQAAQAAGVSPGFTLQGADGLVTRAINPPQPGEVSVAGSFWRAIADQPIAEGTAVEVAGHDSGNELLLLVVPRA